MRACHILGTQLTVLAIANCLLVSGLQSAEAARGCHLRVGLSRLYKTPAAAAAVVRDGVLSILMLETTQGTVGDFRPTADFISVRQPGEIRCRGTKS